MASKRIKEYRYYKRSRYQRRYRRRLRYTHSAKRRKIHPKLFYVSKFMLSRKLLILNTRTLNGYSE